MTNAVSPAYNDQPHHAQAGLLRNAAAEALTRHGNKDGVPALLDAVDGPSAGVRRDALIRLRRLTAQEIPTTVDGTADERKRTLALWRHWWDEAKGLFKPAVSEAPRIHQVYAREQK